MDGPVATVVPDSRMELSLPTLLAHVPAFESDIEKNLRTRRPATLEVCALMQKTAAQRVALDIKYRGFEIPPEFVVGYGLDYNERYRNLPYVALLKPEAYTHR